MTGDATVSGEGKPLGTEEWKAIAALAAPYVNVAIHANEDDVNAAKDVLEQHLSPLVRLFAFAIRVSDGDDLLRAPRTMLAKQDRRFERILRRLPCKLDDADGLLQAAVIVLVREIFPRVPQQAINDWRRTAEDAMAPDDPDSERVRISLSALLDDAIRASPELTRKVLPTAVLESIDLGLMLSMTLFRAVEGAATPEDRAEAAMRATKRVSERSTAPIVRPSTCCGEQPRRSSTETLITARS